MWPEPDQTQELLLQIEEGDEDAVNRLIQRHRDAVRRMVAMRLDRGIAQRVDASDVVQDVMLEATRRMRDYLANPQMPFHLWLRQLAKDRMIDLHRRHHAQRRDVGRERSMTAGGRADQSSLDLARQLIDSELTPAAATVRKELEQRFMAAIDELPEADREIIIMRHAEHLSNSEVAQALDLSPAAAGMRYLRAVRRLRGLLGDPSSPG
ncbi:sigma-70 family RNA polymerase sigma factor [Maioricimonas sp. JC845]|uniref:sigma-70 family RNA polymerase sigma factor n=1 Tax=Maioricimonas sp. JC845 TaxID=3232138 RepID=UPI00345A0EF1